MSSRIYLSIDFGSTYTKLTAIDLDKGEIISTSRAMTTVKTDVLVGFNKAFEELKKDLDRKLKNYVQNDYFDIYPNLDGIWED